MDVHAWVERERVNTNVGVALSDRELATVPAPSMLLSQETIAARVAELGMQLVADYAGLTPLFICILRGATTFLVDLARATPIALEIDYMALSSYGGATKTTGVVQLLKDLETPIQDRHAIIIEDIVDSGLTLAYLRDQLLRREPKSLRICALLRKDCPRPIDVHVDYVGFDIPDCFVVGYGLDYQQRYRNLPYVGILDPSDD
jgi:hypoxanthine phosphoribosyltransferase